MMPSPASKTKPKPSLTFEALGTNWYISASRIDEPDLQTGIRSRIESIDRTWSRFRDDSLVATISRQTGTYRLDDHDAGLMAWYRELYTVTDGLVTPFVGRSLEDTGYDDRYSLEPRAEISTVPAWDDVVSFADNTLIVKQPVLIDVGAAGKGYAIDRVATYLETHGINDYLIDAGGDMRLGAVNQTIGLEHPGDPSLAIGKVLLNNESICGSASNRRTWGDWHHILNPRTLAPVDDVVATWSVADTAMHADGLATALFFVPPERLSHLVDFDYVVVHADGNMRYATNKRFEIFTS